MATSSNRNPARVPVDAGLPQPADASARRDAHGFDPTEFEWRPVPRRPRRDGWTPEVQQRFIEALARTGVVERACEAVNMSVTSAYNLRNAPGCERFAEAWRDVLARAAERLLDVAFEQAIEGEEVPVFDRDGIRIGVKRRYNTRMAMFMLRAYFPERFGHAHQDAARPAKPAPAPPPPVARIVEPLAPEVPAAPHLLATPERLDDMVYGARALANYDASFQPSDHQGYRAPRVPDAHPHVAHRARRNRRLRADRERRQDDALGLDSRSTGEASTPRNPLDDFTYWAEAEARRLKAAGDEHAST